MRRGPLLILVGLIIILAVLAIVFLPGLLETTTPEATQEAAQRVEIPTATPFPFVEIVIAIQELPRGVRIPAEGAVALKRWPAEAAPFNSFQSVDDVIGKIARIDIPRESPILSTMLVDDLYELAERGRVGSDAAAVMPPGLVAVTVPMDRITGVAYAIREGDYVDVIFSALFVDIDEDFQSVLPNLNSLVTIDEAGNLTLGASIPGRLDVGIGGSPVVVGPLEDQRPRLVTQRTVQSAWVLHVGDFPLTGHYIGATPTPRPSPTPQTEEGEVAADSAPVARPTAKPAPDTITLAVSQQDAVVLVWAIERQIPITFALRSARDISQVPTQPVTLEYIMNNFNISLPDRLPYDIEPPARSIRQLVAYEEITLDDAGTD